MEDSSNARCANASDWSGAGLEGAFGAPAAKTLLICFVSMLLMVPTSFAWMLVEERSLRSEDVTREIARAWGGEQSINGPYLVVPYQERVVTGAGDERKEDVERRFAVMFPDHLEIDGQFAVEERKKSIFALPVHRADLSIAGRFDAQPGQAFEAKRGGTIEIEADKAVLVIGIGDVRALKNEVALTLN